MNGVGSILAAQQIDVVSKILSHTHGVRMISAQHPPLYVQSHLIQVIRLSMVTQSA
jgi:hypothetical protein